MKHVFIARDQCVNQELNHHYCGPSTKPIYLDGIALWREKPKKSNMIAHTLITILMTTKHDCIEVVFTIRFMYL